jgi:hypothetical protein
LRPAKAAPGSERRQQGVEHYAFPSRRALRRCR